MYTNLQHVSSELPEKLYSSILQAIEEDIPDAQNYLSLKTHNSEPAMVWDLIHTKLTKTFSGKDIIYSICKQGRWEILLLFDRSSGTLISLMSKQRFDAIKKCEKGQRPQYVQALLLLNRDLKAEHDQMHFEILGDVRDDGCDEHFMELLNRLCESFGESITGTVKNHVLLVFSREYSRLASLNAYVLDTNLDIVEEADWMSINKPIMVTPMETVSAEERKHVQPKLKDKAIHRRKQKELVTPLSVSAENAENQA